ncbi:MAG: Gfo/Idh/MocA family oxidoreductase [Candidatus Aenigmarchaeota archaeon]|nr:Gfo/Idh/MocA family oxidoreductase [Candidatus Aenigmarchaeota archaeon]
MKVAKAGVVGIGSMGSAHYRVYKDLGLNTVGFDVAARPDYNMASDIGELSDCDIVSICTPTSRHVEDAMKIGDIGVKNILVEKPYARTVDECKRLTKYFKDKNIRATVGLIERYNPALRKVSELVKHENILSMIFRRAGKKDDRIKDNISLDIGVHDFDMAKVITGKKLENVVKLREDDLEAMYYGRCGDTNVVIELSWKTGTKARTLSVLTNKNQYYVDYVNFKDPKIIVRGKFDYMWENGDFVKFQDLSGDLKEVSFEKDEPLKSEIFDIITRIERGKEFLISTQEATESVELATS